MRVAKVDVTKYCKLLRILAAADREQSPQTLHPSLKRIRQKPYSVNTDWVNIDYLINF